MDGFNLGITMTTDDVVAASINALLSSPALDEVTVGATALLILAASVRRITSVLATRRRVRTH